MPAPAHFASILAVCSGDEGDRALLARAAELAGAHNARLTVLALVPAGRELDRLARHAGVSAGHIAERMGADARSKAETAVRALDLSARITARVGRPFYEIIRQVIDDGHDLVIKTAEPIDAAHRYLFASTDQHLLRKCPCPVWLVMPESAGPVRHVLAAVDVDDSDADEPGTLSGLNAEIVRSAAAIAALAGATLHLLHVWEAPAEDLVRRWSSDDEGALSYVRDTLARHEKGLDVLAAQTARTFGDSLPRSRIRRHLVRGNPRRAIPEQVRALGADILVMGTLTRTGVPGLIIGNTAEDILNVVECSVVTVKPPGYVSPVAS
ncbi:MULTISPECIES: universal stress protein [unclassified Roseitalea]|uniref:universal stress protein n=1 Tax=unclassified Roseitalea TaxID=2639107 RepID=UPI00273EE421|nr:MULTISPECIES: universal stress protein [unclassified Roseitalea]